MPRRARKQSNLKIHHVILRGINRQIIFEDQYDYMYFIGCLQHYKGLCHFKLYAYCLMDNHIHLLLEETDTALDAYCGIGTIGIVAAKHGIKQVIGVELNGEAVKDAIQNAKSNSLTNIRFYKGDAGDFMEQAAMEEEKTDVVFMDPPRAGSDDAFLQSVITLSPKKVIYISCNPETQARDLQKLIKSGYRVIKIQPVDMFPHTKHIECVCVLTR